MRVGLRDFGERCLYVLGRDGLGLCDRGGEERVMSEEVHLSWQPAGRLEDGFDGRGLEERYLAAGQAHAVIEVASDLVAGDAADVCSYDDALRERLERGHPEAPTKLRVADEDHAESALRIHRVVGQQTQVFQDLGAEMVRFVDDQDRLQAVLGVEARDLGADVLEERGSVSLS